MTRSTPPLTARVHEYLTRLAQTYVVTPALRDEALALADEIEHERHMSGVKRGAAHLGIPVAEYARRVEAGERWCAGCHAWHAISEFGRDRSRPDGLNHVCRAHAKGYQRRYDQRRRTGGAA